MQDHQVGARQRLVYLYLVGHTSLGTLQLLEVCCAQASLRKEHFGRWQPGIQ